MRVGVASGERPEIRAGAISNLSPFSLGVAISTTQPSTNARPSRVGAMGAATLSEWIFAVMNPTATRASNAPAAIRARLLVQARRAMKIAAPATATAIATHSGGSTFRPR